MSYGKELVLDMYGCNPVLFTRGYIEQFLIELCELIDMERCDLHFWDYVGYPEEKATAPMHLDGTTAVQFIKTSNITIHTLDQVDEMYLNLFSCKHFEQDEAAIFITDSFKCTDWVQSILIRGERSRCQNI